jgi:hypothetical protein
VGHRAEERGGRRARGLERPSAGSAGRVLQALSRTVRVSLSSALLSVAVFGVSGEAFVTVTQPTPATVVVVDTVAPTTQPPVSTRVVLRVPAWNQYSYHAYDNQNSTNEFCLATALAMVARFYGGDYDTLASSLDKMIADRKLEPTGWVKLDLSADSLALQKCLGGTGRFVGQVFRSTSGDLVNAVKDQIRAGNPVIGIKKAVDDKDFDHSYVIVGYDDGGLLINDPANSKDEPMPQTIDWALDEAFYFTSSSGATPQPVTTATVAPPQQTANPQQPGTNPQQTANPQTTFDPGAYVGHIVKQLGGATTSWYVTADRRRLEIPDGGSFQILQAWGAPGPDWLGSDALKQLPVLGGYAATGDRMTPNLTLGRGMFLKSSDGRFTLQMQTDGNLVLYSPSAAVWASNTANMDYVVFQGDGNLVGYRDGQSPLAVWSSGTPNQGATSVILENWGRLAIKNSPGSNVWTTRLPDYSPSSGWQALPDTWAYRAAVTRSWPGAPNPWFAVHVGSDHCLYWSTNGNWTKMASTWATDVAAFTNPDGRVEIFNIGSGGKMWQSWQSSPGGPFSAWTDRGGSWKAVAVTQGYQGTWHLFAIDNNGSLSHMAPSDGVPGWAPLSAPGGLVHVAAMRNADSRIELLATDGSGAIYHSWQTAGGGANWSGWVQQTGQARDVAFGMRAGGGWSMYQVGTDNRVYVKSLYAADDWQQLSGVNAMTIAVTTNTDGRQELICVGTGNAIYHAWMTNPTEW